MALQPSLSPLVIGSPSAPHTLEFYYDFVCPFSRKSYKTTYNYLKPLVTEGKLTDKVRIILRLHPQPWHGSSTFTHEAALAVLRAAPEKVLEYFQVLFENQEQFFDIPSSSLTPKQIREQLADLAQPLIGDNKVAQVKDLLTHKTTPNGGTAVTEDLKYNIKVSRHNSIHVSPTVLFDGLIASDVSSSWQEAEWTKFFDSKVTV